MSAPYVCSAKYSGSLDNSFRRLFHNPVKILSPYISEGMAVLDMGCGPGYFTLGIARLVGASGKVTAADLQQEMLNKMVQKLSMAGLAERVHPHKCAQETTGIAGKFDFILCFWMAHEVPDQDRFIAEMKSLLNPGGKMLVSEPKIHVTGKAFEKTKAKIVSAGFNIAGNPDIAISRSLIASL